ncbi:CHRD domain-containing protein [Wenjunlia tyrosinilytica]|uniref:CHRD domain-containing protein n=1 Tax=Wenjunlia tyrosinilytica TaxID=1544741 RepID=A0A918E0F7_9ACTN|nr:CHRD domain-containing protein [Wenjunlia tyrosinilytica]GGO92851.1 hypothetical protein GCM10012280_43970 [Wenjunlia tyrosinilytica]
MRKSALTLSAAALTLGIAAASPAVAHGTHGAGHGAVEGSAHQSAPMTPAHGPSVFLGARLTGGQEVQAPGGPAVGDPDGKAVALVRVQGDRVTFALQWRGIGAPTLGHIHQGKAGANGDVKVPLFGTAMPDTVDSAAGQVSVTDAELAQDIRSNPDGFYVNLHSKEFPGGAVRGQLKPLSHPVNPLDIVRGGKLHALADGGQEVPGADPKVAVGDPDGHAIAFLHPRGTEVDYSLAWVNIGAPTLGHIHQGGFGKNGDVKVPLFTTPVPQNIFAISGTVPNQNPAVVKEVRHHPGGFYANVHTAQFPGGAVRGQLFQ